MEKSNLALDSFAAGYSRTMLSRLDEIAARQHAAGKTRKEEAERHTGCYAGPAAHPGREEMAHDFVQESVPEFSSWCGWGLRPNRATPRRRGVTAGPHLAYGRPLQRAGGDEGVRRGRSEAGHPGQEPVRREIGRA